MSTTYSIKPIERADLVILEDFLVSSKLQLSINRFLFADWPNEPAQRPVYRAALESGFTGPTSRTLKAVDDSSGEIVGHLVLTRRIPAAAATEAAGDSESIPKGKVDEGPAQKHENVAEKSSPFVPETLAAVMRIVEEADAPVKNLDHLQITHIYVRPSYRRKGVGSQFVLFARQQAKDAGVPLAVSSEPQAHKFFLSLKFTDTTYGEVDLGQFADPHCGYGKFRLFGMKMVE